MNPLLDVRKIIAGLEDPQGFLAGLFEASPVSMQAFDASGRCRLANAACERLFGSVPPPEYNIFEDDIAQKTGMAALIARAFAGETITTPPVWYDPRALTNVKVTEGRRVAIVVTFFPLRDAKGVVKHVVLIHQDVTALKTHEESLATTLRSIGDAVIATDAGGRVTTMNPVAEQLTGWSLAEALGKPLESVFRIVSEDDGKPVPSPVDKVLREGVIVGMANHTALVHRDGRQTPIADSAAPIKGEDGRLSGVVLVFRDATQERKAAGELRASEEKLRALLDNAPIVLWSVDTNAVFQMAAGAGLKSVGLRPQDLVGKQFFDMFADMPDAAHWRQALKGEQQQYKTA
jgi:PAS domain S-box-containing protein